MSDDSDTTDDSTHDYKSDTDLPGYCTFCFESEKNGTLNETLTNIYNITDSQENDFDDSDIAEEIAVENDTIEENVLCETAKGIDNIFLDRVILIPALAIVVCLALFLQRKYILKNFLNGRPGFIYPLNLLEGEKHRIGYALAFVVVSLHMFDMVITTKTDRLPFKKEELVPNMKRIIFLSVFFLSFIHQGHLAFFMLAGCIMKALEFYPVFACLTADNLFGYGVGSLYMWTLFVTSFFEDRLCFSGTKEIRILEMCKLVPPAICMACLCLYFPFRFVKHLIQITKNEKEITKNTLIHSHNMLYVKELMNKHKFKYVPPTRFIDKIRYKIYWPLPTFKYSICIMTAVLTGLCFTYMAALGELAMMYELIEKYKKILRLAVKAKKISKKWMGPSVMLALLLKMDVDTMYRWLVKECIFWVNWIFEPLVYLSIALAFVSVFISMLLTMKNYRHNLFTIYKNQHEDLQRADSFKPRGILINGVKFVGYQISYAAWGFVMQSAIIFLITFFVGSILTLMIRYELYEEILMWFIDKFWCVIATIVLLLVVQNLMAHFVFLLKGDNGSKVLALNNRRVFFNFHYFAVFTNIAVGLVSCILRIFRAVIFGLWTVPRLDMSTLSRHLEGFDAGYTSYLGLLYLEHTQRNPTLLVFANIMSEIVENENRNTVTISYNKKQITKKVTKEFKLVRNRYYLWLTLERNPGLRLYRKFGPGPVATDGTDSKKNEKLFVPRGK